MENHGSLRFDLLGPVRAWRDESQIDLGAPKQQAVAAVLLLRNGQAVSRDTIVDAVWGDDPPGGVVNVVHRYVAGLRRALEPDRGARAPGRVLRSTGAGYQMSVARDTLDLGLFEDHVARGRRLRTESDLDAAVRAFDTALALWHGDPLSGVPGPFVQPERTRLLETRIMALEERAEALLGLERPADVVSCLSPVISQYPLRERLREMLMLALYRQGRQAEALDVFRDVRRVLVEDLGVEPSRRLRRLHERILKNDPGLELARTTPTPTVPEPAVAATVTYVAAQLPHDVTGFTGRDAELLQLRENLGEAAPETTSRCLVISTIDGAAGVGKTALAVRFAHDITDEYPDGQYYIDLRGFDANLPPLEPGEALGQLLRGLNVDPTRIPGRPDQQAALYRTVLAHKRALILLDNASSADHVRPLLPGSGGCLVIVTSRNRLSGLVARDGARRLTLDVLSARDSATLLARALGTERATAEPGAIEELARLCGRLPLALRIAGERAVARPHLTLTDLVDELTDEHDRLDVLAAGDDESAAVRAAFSWSYRALPPTAMAVFRRLGLHAGRDIGVPAAAALGGVTMAEAERTLETLAAGHLIQEVARGRYRLHDLLRVYAAECAARQEPTAERTRAVRRVLDWYLQTADAADQILIPPRRRVPLDAPQEPVPALTFHTRREALDWCETEHANLVALTRQAALYGEHAIAWQLPLALWGYFMLRKPWNDWIATHLTGLASARQLGDLSGEAHLLGSLAFAYNDLRRCEEAIECVEKALTICRETDDHWGEGVALIVLGLAHRNLRRLDEAIDCFERSLRIWRRIGDRWGEGLALTGLGLTYRNLNRFDEAIDCFGRSLGCFRETDDPWGASWTLTRLCIAYLGLERYEEAIDFLRQALAICSDIGDRQREGETLRGLGNALFESGRLDEARQCWQEALAILQELGDPQAADLEARIRSV